jgi:4-hydroxythreonine-4-phosphate dehydrogenase
LGRLRTTGSVPQLILVGPTGFAPAGLVDAYIDVGEFEAADAASAGRVAGLAIERAVQLALAGQVDAIVTAPIEKSAFHAAGYPYPGHTELLAALSGHVPVAMMMCAEETRLGGPLRVVLATTHLRLADVSAALTTELLVEQATLTRQALTEDWSIEEPRLALCALNPHASDSGLFGDEEERVMRPAVEALRSAGTLIVGPVPADTVFVRALRGEFDAVLAPYHDVGMAAFKTASFGSGVNVTLGLPFPRTSPDHGTALDIAGRGRADPSSMLEAIELAIRLANSRKQTNATLR